MSDDNDVDDSWLYGAGQDESSHQESKQEETEVTPVKNGNENKTYENTFDEHNFEACIYFEICIIESFYKF